MTPALGVSSPAMRLSKVDLPLPDGPSRAMRSRVAIVNVVGSSATTRRAPLPKKRARP